MNEYEATRAAQIAHNKALIASLGLAKPSTKRSPSDNEDDVDDTSGRRKPSKKKKAGTRPTKPVVEPVRRSSRVVKSVSEKEEHVSLPDDWNDADLVRSSRRAGLLNSNPIKQLPAPEYPTPDPEELDYDPDFRAPLPTRDSAQANSGYGKLRFEDVPHFTPNLLPEEILRLGSFGGTYWRPLYSRVCRRELVDDYREFPEEWYADLDVETYMTSTDYDPELNQYGVKASQSIEEWEKAGWIVPQDPRGWMQWYFRFYQGRRTPDDDRQIRRYLAAVGPRGRFKTGLAKKIAHAGGVESWDDKEIAPILRQTLQHWAVRITREDMQEYMG